jgi:hypothetical protein
MSSLGPRERYFEVLDRTLELESRLERFIDGYETPDTLQAWVRSFGDHQWTQEGPLHSNATATEVFVNLWNGAQLVDPERPDLGCVLRTSDVREYLRLLRRGTDIPLPWELGNAGGPLLKFAERVGVRPVRHIIDRADWFEVVRFASPATGRLFSMRHPLASSAGGRVVFRSEAMGTQHECLVDLLETLAIDLSDFHWVSKECVPSQVPRWRLWCDDDKGSRICVATFTGRRKALGAMAQYGARDPEQTYWVEQLAGSGD